MPEIPPKNDFRIGPRELGVADWTRDGETGSVQEFHVQIDDFINEYVHDGDLSKIDLHCLQCFSIPYAK